MKKRFGISDMPKYDTVIFDLDGTLLDTLEDLCDSTNFALSQFGYPIRTLSEIRSFVGNGIGVLIEKALPQGKENIHYEEVLKTFKAHYSLNCNNKTHAYDGVDWLLHELKSNGYKIAVVSNKVDDAVKDLCKRYFNDTVEIAIGETETIRRKPAPDEVYTVMDALDATKESAIYIGDSEVDILTARNAQIDCISVSWGFRSEAELIEAGAVMISDTPEDVFKLIISL